MFNGDLKELFVNPWYLLFEGFMFAVGAAPAWHIIERLMDKYWPKL